ncbi:hypothetical protein HZC31_07740 [Candidatus Woesearchaeota archaeon]|nr:hypothetical protein [Candidatus Woesearchaeota archaeon]
MVRRYSPLTFSALSLIPFFSQACLPPFPDVILVEDATISVVSLDTVDTASSGEMTLDDLLTFSATFATNAQNQDSDNDSFAYALRVNVDDLGAEKLELQGDFTTSDNYKYSASFAREYPAGYFDQGEHTAVFQGLLYYIDPENKEQYGITLYSPEVEVPFTIIDNDIEAPSISDLIATPQYTGNDSTILLEATVTDNKGIERVLATIAGTEYVLSDSDGDSVYSTTIDPSTFSLTPTETYTEFSFTVSATDTNENTTTSDSALFYLSDAIAPEVADAGTSTETDNSPLTTWSVYATATDLGTGVESVFVELNENGVLLPLAYQGSDIYALDLTGDNLSAPSTTYILHAFDYAGLESTATGTVSVENITGLTINDLVLSPSTVSNASTEYVTITLDAEDLQDAESDLIASCTIDTLEVPLSYESGTQFTGTFQTADFLVAQDYSVSCTAEDTDGYTANRSTALTLTDGLAPEVSCSATNAANDGSSSIDISCTVSDETGLASSNPVTYTSTLGSDALTNTSGSTYEASIPVSGVAAGTYSIDILATDAAGNTQTQTVSSTVTDATAPTYASLSASPSSVSNDGSSFVVSATTVYDETAITAISVTLDGTAYTMTDADGDSTYETAAITPTSWPASSYTLDLVISDGTNETTGATTVDVTDGVGPTVSSCSATTASNSGSIDSTFTAVATDETGVSTVSYTADFGSDALSLSSGSTYTKSVDLTGVAAGTYSVDFSATDAAGNTSSSCTASFTLLDTSDPAIVCTLGSSSITNSSGSTTLDCVVSEETGISSVSYSGFGSGSLTASSSTDYSTTLTASSTTAADSYTIPVIVTDTSGNTDSYSVTLTVTDGTAPTIDSVYTLVDGSSSSTILDDGTQDFLVYVCNTDETDGAELGGGVEATIDTLVETLSYDSSTQCFVSREIGGDELSAGTYTVSATATDAAGNSTTDTSASLEVTCSAVTVSSVTVSESSIYNNNIPNTYTISADITVGSCGGSVDTSSLEVTINGTTESMSLSSGSTYVSGEFDALGTDLGSYTVSVTGADSLGNSTTNTDETITVEDICDNLATDAPTATIGAYVAGNYAGALTSTTSPVSSWPAGLASLSEIQVGSYGTSFTNPVIINYNGALGKVVYLTSACSGGSSSGSTYTTSSYNVCTITGTYDATTYPVSVYFETAGDSTPTFSIHNPSLSGSVNYYKSSSTCYVNSNGNSAALSSCGSTTRPVTFCLNF